MALPSVSTPLDQYRALTEGVALLDRSGVGVLRLSGGDAVDLLDRLSTNDLRGLTPGTGAGTVLTTNKGRIIDFLTVVRMDDHLLVLCSAQAAGRVAEWIDFYTFEEDVTVTEMTGGSFVAGLVGPTAAGAVRALAGDAAADLPPYGAVTAAVDGVTTTLVRTDWLGTAGFDFIAPADEGAYLAGSLEAAAEPSGSEAPEAPMALEALRIERGVPAFGSELNEERNPLEAGLIDSVSFNKGCYIGQEVVARLNTYDKVQRRLGVLVWERGAVSPGDPVLVPDEGSGDGKEIGVVTSVAAHPNGGFVGLAYVRRAFEGDGVAIGSSGVAATLRPAG